MGSQVAETPCKTQGKLLAECFELLVESGVCPETTPREWITMLLYLHHKGWLFASANNAGNVDTVAAGYRVPDLKKTDVLPRQERGRILYVPFYASRRRGRLTALRCLRAYLNGHERDVSEVAFHRLGSDDEPRRYTVRGGKLHEQ